MMNLNLADLSLRVGERHTCTCSLEIAPVVLGGVEYSVLAPDGMQIVVERIAGGYLVDIEFNAKVYGPCTRCLKECSLEVPVAQQEYSPATAGEWDEGSMFIEDLEVDVSGLAREALVLAMPQPLLCAEECKGICAVCGADLNSGPCGCDGLE